MNSGSFTDSFMNKLLLLEKKYKDVVVKFAPFRSFITIPYIRNYAQRKGFTHFSVYRPKIKLYAHYDSGKTIEVGILNDDIVSLPDYEEKNE